MHSLLATFVGQSASTFCFQEQISSPLCVHNGTSLVLAIFGPIDLMWMLIIVLCIYIYIKKRERKRERES